jgi:thiaminase/transcriptional activator TenA
VRDDRFTTTLWEAIRPIDAAILRHPFLTGLTDGTLPRDRFAFYITQDALYLKQFARALMALAVSGRDEALALFSRHAGEALEVERALHEGIVRDLGMHPEQVQAAAMAPTCQAYTDFLLASALGRSFPEALAAVLPCYWIYQRVGKHLLPQGSPDPIYRRWIETYGGELYDRTVTEVLDLTNRLAPGLGRDTRDAMKTRFILASRYEWMFWDMAYRLETWPVGTTGDA